MDGTMEVDRSESHVHVHAFVPKAVLMTLPALRRCTDEPTSKPRQSGNPRGDGAISDCFLQLSVPTLMTSTAIRALM